MTPEERFTRLEQHHDILVQLLIETRELNERAQAQLDRMDARTRNLEGRTKILTELARDHEDRIDTQLTWINQLGEGQAGWDAQLAALAESHARLEASYRRTEETMRKLAESHLEHDRKFNEFVARSQKQRDTEA